MSAAQSSDDASVPLPAGERGRIARLVIRYGAAAILLWTVLLGISLWWNVGQQKATTTELALNTARSAFNKDLAYRRWASGHGGVYVEPTEKTPPSPWMAHLPDRDLTASDGRLLTLMNPAYMLREMMADYGDDYGIKGRIIGIAHSLGLKVVAEGIEELDQMEILHRQECDGIQGYLIAKPMTAELATIFMSGVPANDGAAIV